MKPLANTVLADLEQLHVLELLRSNSVERFAMTPMTRNQTIAAHQWEVAMLFIRISKYIYEEKDSPMTDDRQWMLTGMLLAMTHDIAEVFTGDIPAPAKTAYTLQVNYTLPSWAKRMMKAWKPNGTTTTEDFIITAVKLCDVISTWWWAAQYGNTGDAYTKSMVNNLEKDMYVRLASFILSGAKLGYIMDLELHTFPDQLIKGTARTVFDLVEEYDDKK